MSTRSRSKAPAIGATETATEPWLRRLFEEAPAHLKPGAELEIDFQSAGDARGVQRWLWRERKRRLRQLLDQTPGLLDPDAADTWAGLVTRIRSVPPLTQLIVRRPPAPTALRLKGPGGAVKVLSLGRKEKP